MYTVSLRNLNAVAIFNAEPSSRGGVGALAWLISSPNGGSADVPSDFNITDEVGRRSGLVFARKIRRAAAIATVTTWITTVQHRDENDRPQRATAVTAATPSAATRHRRRHAAAATRWRP